MADQKRKNQTFELEKIINFLETTGNGKIIAIAGKINNKKSRILNSLYQYLSQADSLDTNKNTSFLNSVIEQTKKQNHKLELDPSHKKHSSNENRGVYNYNINVVPQTINDCLKANLKIENISKKHFFGNNAKKRKLKKVFKKIVDIEKQLSKIETSNKMKLIFPILTTITTIGTSIGTPILSIALLRYKEIIDAISYIGYASLLSFCGVAIISGLVSVIIYLITTLIASKRELIATNLLEEYKKILSNYYALPNQNKDETKNYARKIQVNKHFNYFYDDVVYDQKDYWNLLNLLMVHNALGNNVCFTVSISDEYQLKNIFNDSWGGSANYHVFYVNNYKNGYNKERIIKFLLARIGNDFDFNFKQLYKNNDTFRNNIEQFYEYSTNNLQILNVLNTFKTTGLAKVDKNKIKNNINYYVDIFYLFLIKSIDFFSYDILVDSLLLECKIPSEIDKKYSSFNISKFITRNFKSYKQNSILFRIGEYNEDNFNEVKAESENEIKNKIEKFIEEKGFSNIKKSKSKSLYKNKFDDVLQIITIDNFDKIDDILKKINEIKNLAFIEKVEYLIINFNFEFIVFKRSLNNFHVVDKKKHNLF